MSFLYASAVGYRLRTISSSRVDVGAARFEPRVIDVERLELPSETFLDQGGDLRDERRGEDVLQHLADPRLGDLPVLVEAPRDHRRRGRGVGIREPGGPVGPEEPLVTRVRLGAGPAAAGRGRVGVLLGGWADFVRERVPVHLRVVDDGRGDRLRHDPVHDFRDRPLFREPRLRVAVVRLDLVAQVPVREQAQLRREEAAPLVVHEVVHPDVVFGDVLLGFRGGSADREIHVGRDALGEPLGQPRFRPLAARPLFPVAQTLLERRQREVQKHGEGELVSEEVVGDVRRRIVAGERLVEGVDRPQVKVRLLAKVPPDLEHVPVERLQRELHPIEERVERLRIAGEARLHEVLEHLRVPVVLAPEPGNLLQPPREPRPRIFSVFRAEVLLEPRACVLHPGGRPRAPLSRLLAPRNGHGGQENNREQNGLLHWCRSFRAAKNTGRRHPELGTPLGRRRYLIRPGVGPPPCVGTRRPCLDSENLAVACRSVARVAWSRRRPSMLLRSRLLREAARRRGFTRTKPS